MVVPADEFDPVSLRSGARHLGHDLARSLPSDDGNLVYSPTSLALAFAMLREGAGGQTAAEIDEVLHFPADRQTAYNALIHELADVGEGDVLEVNDALFVDPSLEVEPGYLEQIKKWYGAGVEQTEFPAPALGDINGWVDDKTHGRIPKLIDQLDPQAVFALVNTIYLKAKWDFEFDPTETIDQTFTRGDGSTVTATMMRQTHQLEYAQGDGWQAVRLAYAGGKLSMWVLLPDQADGDPRDLLDVGNLAEVESAFASRNVALSLPRWDTETGADLTSVLREVGMRRTFDDGDYRALTANPAFEVTQVLQQANITVGEEGTEAAAATAIVGETSAPAPPPNLVKFRADHPFAFAIMHDATGVPLFEGVVADPS
jgi:serpin B